MDIRSFFGAKTAKPAKADGGAASKNNPVQKKPKEAAKVSEKSSKNAKKSVKNPDAKATNEAKKKSAPKCAGKKVEDKAISKVRPVDSSPDVVEIEDSDSTEFVSLNRKKKAGKETCEGYGDKGHEVRKENAKQANGEKGKKRKSCVIEDEEEDEETENKRRKEDAEETENKRRKEDAKTAKTKEKGSKKQKAETKPVVDDVTLINGDDSDENVKAKAKPSSKKKGAVIYDSDSDGDCVSPTPQKKIVAKRGRSKVKHSNIIIDSDSSDVISPSPEKKKKAGRKRAKKDRYAISDSDDDRSPPKNAIADAFAKTTPHVVKPVATATIQKEATVRKATSAADFFGTGAVQSVERRETGSAAARKDSKAASQEATVHSDDDFANTLMQLDGNQNVKTVSKSDSKETSSSVSLSSKLAAKVTATAKTPDTTSQSEQFTEGSTGTGKPSKKTTAPEKTETKCKKSPSTIKTTSPLKKSPTITTKTSPTEAASSPPKKSPTTATKTSPTDTGDTDTPKRTGYWAYKNREGPRAPGSKEIPQGSANCLEGLTFVVTGVLDSLERDEARGLIERHGGRVVTSVSRRTSYIVAGCDAGESKLAKAREFRTKQIDEDGLLGLLRTLPAKKSRYEVKAMAEVKEEAAITKAKSAAALSVSPTVPDSAPAEVYMWVDKYRPRSVKQLIGQSGEQSCARKLAAWLTAWHRHLEKGTKPAFGRFGGDGAGYRAALLSGPPGIGKTSTAQLVAKEAGFTYIELNASDTRSKRSLQEEVANALSNHSVARYFGTSTKTALNAKHHCLLMDEVDGMAGNEDRGGIQELVQLIKHTHIPIICMCNDRNHMKMRTLSNYAFDLRFQRPRVEQIKAAMMTIAYKEGLKMPAPAMNEIIEAANHDIRQVIHNLSLWTVNAKTPSFDQLKSDAGKAKKDLKLGPFDACRKVFAGGEEKARMSFIDKSDLFFHDYSLAPLFVQENYIHVTPFSARGDEKKHLDLLSRTADSIANGDLVDRLIRGAQNWSLLPLQAVYASVLPGEYLQGHLDQMIQFPLWLGRNSSRTKHDRLLQQLSTHMTLKVSSDRRGMNLDYLPHLRGSLTRPLKRDTPSPDDIGLVTDVMQHYDLTRDDFDAVLELTQWPGMADPMASVESKVKAAFTRTYNKLAIMTPYAMSAPVKKGRQTQAVEDTEDDPHGEDEEDGDDLGTDAMIKQKKKATTVKKKTAGSNEASTSGKGKGGKGKGPAKGKGKGKK